MLCLFVYDLANHIAIYQASIPIHCQLSLSLRHTKTGQAQQKEQQEQESTNSVIADLQELNERMARIQAQLVEASQIDDKINSKVNLLDVTT